MAVSVGTAYADIAPRLVRNFSQQTVNQMVRPMAQAGDKAGEESGRRFGLRFNKRLGAGFSASTGIASRAAAGIAGAFAAVSVVSLFSNMITEAREAAKITRITEARIRSTGGAANITAGQVGRLAEAISNNVGVDDELIQSGQNLLLTFKGVANQAGKNNDIFNQASRLAVDLAAGMNNGVVSAGGLRTANIQLGKALEDPIRGITALRRSGVSFTEQQREQIKTLVESGNTLGAQKIILKAVGEQFAGTAKAAADPMQRLRTIIGNVAERIGTALLPFLDKAAAFLSNRFIPAAEAFAARHGPAFAAVLKRIGGFLSDLIGFVSRNHKILEVLGGTILVVVAAIRVWVAVTRAYAVAQAALNLVLAANPIGLVVVAIAALVAGLVLAYRRSDTFRKIVDGAFRAVATAAKFMWERVLRPTFSFLVRTWLTVAGGIVRGAALAFGWVPGIGPKLRTAAAKFHEFAGSVNRSLNRINDERVNLKVVSQFKIPGMSVHDIVGRARGGPITSGVRSHDSTLAMLRRGEHVWTPEEVDAAGGHGAMLSMRRAVLAGDLPGFQRGGGVQLRTSLPSPGRVAAAISGAVDRFANMTERAYGLRFAAFGGVGGTGVGGTVGAAANAWRIFRRVFGLPMGGRAPRANVSDHPVGKAIDIMTTNRALHRAIIALGKQLPGAKYWISYRQIGHARSGFRPNYYGGPSPHTDHVHWSFYDKGGWLQPGVNVAVNRTGRRERVLAPGEGAQSLHVTVDLRGSTLLGGAAEISNKLAPELRSRIRDLQRRAGVPPAAQLR